MIVDRPLSRRLRLILAHGFLIGFIALILFPFLMVLSISLREGNFSLGALIPDRVTFEHWALAFGQTFSRPDGTVVTPPFNVLNWMANSVKIAAVASAGIVVISTVAAYGFARLTFRGKTALLDGLFIVQMFPATLTLIALYALFDALGEISPVLGIDSPTSLVLVYLSGTTMHIWTLKGYFASLDPALDQAAQIDGATPFQAFRHIFLPLATPMIAVVFVLAFIGIINEYPTASVLLRSDANLTLAVGSRLYLNEHQYLWGDFAAAAILSGIPITIVFLVAQRYLVAGLAEGGVKG